MSFAPEPAQGPRPGTPTDRSPAVIAAGRDHDQHQRRPARRKTAPIAGPAELCPTAEAVAVSERCRSRGTTAGGRGTATGGSRLSLFRPPAPPPAPATQHDTAQPQQVGSPRPGFRAPPASSSAPRRRSGPPAASRPSGRRHRRPGGGGLAGVATAAAASATRTIHLFQRGRGSAREEPRGTPLDAVRDGSPTASPASARQVADSQKVVSGAPQVQSATAAAASPPSGREHDRLVDQDVAADQPASHRAATITTSPARTAAPALSSRPARRSQSGVPPAEARPPPGTRMQPA